jgi:hypothetical protein
MLVCRAGLAGSPAGSPADSALLGLDEYWLQSLARELKIPRSVLSRWCCRGWVHARKVTITHRRWVVWADADEKDRLRRLHAIRRLNPAGRYPPELTTPKARANR